MNDFNSFKISDAVRRPVDRASAARGQKAPAKGQAAPEENTSVGFPRIEALLDGNVDLAGLKEREAALKALTKQPGSPKQKAAATKAAKAYGLTVGMIEHLFATKAAMENQA